MFPESGIVSTDSKFVDLGRDVIVSRLSDNVLNYQSRDVLKSRYNISSLKEEANEFLKEYLSGNNRRFRALAVNKINVHVRFPCNFKLDKYPCVKTERTVRNDSTIACNGKFY
jgi:hypothetical protein